MARELLEREFEFFKKNQEALVKKYDGKFLVIKDEEVKGVFDSEVEAYQNAKNEYEVGTFLIQHCIPGEGGYSQTYHSRVVIEN